MLKFKKILVSFLIVLFTTAPFVIPFQTVKAQGDWASNIWASIMDTIQASQGTIETTKTLKDGFWAEILDVVAITVAQKSSEMMSKKISNWIAGGLKDPLFVEGDFKKLFQDLPKEVLKQGLSTLLKFENTTYAHTNGELPVDLTVAQDNLPAWVLHYIRRLKTFTVESAQLPINILNNETYFSEVATGVGIKEISGFFDPNTINTSSLLANLPEASLGMNSFNLPPKNSTDVLWEISIGFIDCTKISFIINGNWEPISYTNQSKVIDGWNSEFYVPIYEESGAINENYKHTYPPTFQPKASRYECPTTNIAGGVNFARNIVNQQNKSFEDLLTNTFKQATGVEIEDFLNDSEVFLRNLRSDAIIVGKTTITGKDPYAAYDLLNDIDKNPIGAQLELTKKLQKSINSKLAGQELELTSEGHLPEKECQLFVTIEFKDGNPGEKICTEALIKNPSGTISGLAKKGLEAAFDFNSETKGWQQALATASINLVVGAIDGGVKYIASEVKKNSSNTTIGIKGLGIFDWLNPETAVASEANTENPNLWKSIADREIDFSKITEQIHLTQQEAEIMRQTSEIYRPYPAKGYILDHECVLGPDIGYESRIRSLIQPRTSDISTKISTAGDENAEAWQNFLDHLNKKMEEQIDFVEQALASSPFPGQRTFQDTIRKIREENRTISQVKNQAVDKRNTASQLLSIRNTINATKNAGGTTVDLSPLLTPVPKWPKEEEIKLYSLITSNQTSPNNATTISDLNNLNSIDPNVFDPTDQDGDGIPDDQQNQLESDSDGDGLIDSIEVSICLSFGLCDTNDYYVTKDKTDGFNVDTTSDWDLDDNKRDGNGYLIGGTDLEEYTGVDSTGEEIKGSHNPKYIDYIDPFQLEESKGQLIPGSGINFEAPNYTGGTVQITDPTLDYSRLYYLSDLQSYNAQYNEFLVSLSATTASGAVAPGIGQARRTLSRLVSQYENIAKDISTQTSIQRARGSFESARQKNANIEDLIDQCYQIFYQIDKGTTVEKEDIPRRPYSVLGFGLIPNIPDFKCQETNTGDLTDPKKWTGNFCFGDNFENSVHKFNGSGNLQNGGTLLSEFKYKEGGLANRYVKFLKYEGADLFGFAKNIPMYHKNPNFIASELINTPSSNDDYDIGFKPFLDIYRDGLQIISEDDTGGRIIEWKKWKRPGEYPFGLETGQEYSTDFTGFTTGNTNTTIEISDVSGVIYALEDPYAMDKASLLYCDNKSILYTDIKRYNWRTYREESGGGQSPISSSNWNYGFLDDGNKNHIINMDAKWDQISCSDWYSGTVNDYFPEEEN